MELPDLDIFSLKRNGCCNQTCVETKWQESVERRPEQYYSLDSWHGSLAFLRQALKGWNLQKTGEQKKTK
jgi:hypothetical protein